MRRTARRALAAVNALGTLANRFNASAKRLTALEGTEYAD